MKILVISDLHAKTVWEDIVAKEGTFDHLVFIGDYFDCYGEISVTEQIYNFQEIIRLKVRDKSSVTVLIGNHDHHYMVNDQNYSGYQHEHALEIGKALEDNIEYLQVAYLAHPILFTHAGVTETWCERNNIDLKANISGQINKKWAENRHILDFHYPSFRSSPTGDNVWQSPVWVRPYSLLTDAIDGYTQVVGHTARRNISKDNWGRYDVWFTDVLDKTNEYLVINIKDEINEFEIKEL